MNNVLKTLYYTSVSAIAIWLFRPILFWITGLEFANSDFELIYVYNWIYILPIAISLTITKEFLNGKKPRNLIRSVFTKIVLSALSVFLVFMSVFTHMCGTIVKEVHYVSKHSSSKIAVTEFGCGAYDSDSNPKQKVKIIRPLNKYLNWTHSCDTSTIDKNEWVKIKY